MARVQALEVATGHDGVLRGAPEPRLLLGVYAGRQGRVILVDRCVFSFRVQRPYPSRSIPTEPRLAGGQIQSDLGFHFKLLLIALEEDGGDDVGRLYGCLEHVQDLSFWRADSGDPSPIPLHETQEPPNHGPTPIHVLFQGRDLSRSCNSDKWIGAAGLTIPGEGKARDNLYRFPLRSADHKNDWTAILGVRTAHRKYERGIVREGSHATRGGKR